MGRSGSFSPNKIHCIWWHSFTTSYFHSFPKRYFCGWFIYVVCCFFLFFIVYTFFRKENVSWRWIRQNDNLCLRFKNYITVPYWCCGTAKKHRRNIWIDFEPSKISTYHETTLRMVLELWNDFFFNFCSERDKIKNSFILNKNSFF